MKFKEGDLVSVLHDNVYGEIIAIKKNSAIVDLNTGFEQNIDLKDLIPYGGYSVAVKKSDVYHKENKQRKKSKAAIKNITEIYVDLHIEKLISSTRAMSNHDIVLYQLKEAENQLKKAIAKKVYKVILIHGKGTGKLKLEIRKRLQQLDFVNQFYDASFKRFNGGATTVELKK